MDKRQQADLMERPMPPKSRNRGHTLKRGDGSGVSGSLYSREFGDDEISDEQLLTEPRKRPSPTIKLGKDFVIIGNQFLVLCSEAEPDAGNREGNAEDASSSAAGDDAYGCIGNADDNVTSKDGGKRGHRDEPVEFKREGSATQLDGKPRKYPKYGKSNTPLNLSIIRNLDRIICQVKAQRKEQLSTRMKGGEFGFICLGRIRNPPKDCEKVLTHRTNVEKKGLTKTKSKDKEPVEVKVEVEEDEQVIVVEVETTKDDDVQIVGKKRGGGRSGRGGTRRPYRRRAPNVNVDDDPFSKEAAESLRRTIRKRMDQVDLKQRRAKAGGKNFNNSSTYMEYDGEDSDDEVTGPSPANRKRKRSALQISDDESIGSIEDSIVDGKDTSDPLILTPVTISLGDNAGQKPKRTGRPGRPPGRKNNKKPTTKEKQSTKIATHDQTFGSNESLASSKDSGRGPKDRKDDNDPPEKQKPSTRDQESLDERLESTSNDVEEGDATRKNSRDGSSISITELDFVPITIHESRSPEARRSTSCPLRRGAPESDRRGRPSSGNLVPSVEDDVNAVVRHLVDHVSWTLETYANAHARLREEHAEEENVDDIYDAEVDCFDPDYSPYMPPPPGPPVKRPPGRPKKRLAADAKGGGDAETDRSRSERPVRRLRFR